MCSVRFAGLLTQVSVSADAVQDSDEDCLEILALPGSTGGPPLTSQRCLSLKWAESPLNTTAGEALAAPLSALREFRDGATLIFRSRVASIAAAQADTGETAEETKTAGQSAVVGKAHARRSGP